MLPGGGQRGGRRVGPPREADFAARVAGVGAARRLRSGEAAGCSAYLSTRRIHLLSSAPFTEGSGVGDTPSTSPTPPGVHEAVSSRQRSARQRSPRGTRAWKPGGSQDHWRAPPPSYRARASSTRRREAPQLILRERGPMGPGGLRRRPRPHRELTNGPRWGVPSGYMTAGEGSAGPWDAHQRLYALGATLLQPHRHPPVRPPRGGDGDALRPQAQGLSERASRLPQKRLVAPPPRRAIPLADSALRGSFAARGSTVIQAQDAFEAGQGCSQAMSSRRRMGGRHAAGPLQGPCWAGGGPWVGWFQVTRLTPESCSSPGSGECQPHRTRGPPWHQVEAGAARSSPGENGPDAYEARGAGPQFPGWVCGGEQGVDYSFRRNVERMESRTRQVAEGGSPDDGAC